MIGRHGLGHARRPGPGQDERIAAPGAWPQAWADWPRVLLALLLWTCVVVLPAAAQTADVRPRSAVAVWLEVVGPIGPATVRYIQRGLAQAQQDDAPLVVIALDTPGGLDSAMRKVVQAMLASPVPVVVHVSPDGARAASAGTFLLYAAHIAAMAPATTLGAATPVPLNLPVAPTPTAPPAERPAARPGGADDGGAVPSAAAAQAKSVHDAAAYIRGLAQLRGRNADWAERAVREAASLTAQEALREGVIDLVADSPRALLLALDGRTVRIGERQVTLRTAALEPRPLPPRAHERLIATLTQPSVALLLLMLGLWALVLEFAQPGFSVAGTFGAISLLMALYALQLLPVNVVGLALLALGLALMVAEALTPGLGVLGLGGTTAFVAGGLLLFEGDTPGFGLPLPVVLGLGLLSVLAMLGVSSLAWRARSRPVVAGPATLVGTAGHVLSVDPGDDRHGWAEVQGVPWRVRGAQGLHAGEPVTVAGAEGSTLTVVGAALASTPAAATDDVAGRRPTPPAKVRARTAQEAAP
jgi:membrane-bound serine protease (ClpP class)